MNIAAAIRETLSQVPEATGALPAAAYYVEHSSMLQITELQKFQDHVLSTLNPKCLGFILPKPREFRMQAWVEGGALFTARFEIGNEIAGSMVGTPLRNRSAYAEMMGIDLRAGRDCWFDRSTLYLSSGLVDRKYNHHGVMEQMLLSAQYKLDDSGYDSLCFLATTDNLPMLRTALRLGFYIIGVGYHAGIDRMVFLFEYEKNGTFARQGAATSAPILRRGELEIELENLLDDDYAITGIDIHTRTYSLHKLVFSEAKPLEETA